MTTTQIFCDYCGKQIEKRDGEFELAFRVEPNKPSFKRLKLDDLCGECTKRIYNAINKRQV